MLMPNNLNIATINLIKTNEGCVLHAYQDMVGVWTIGYGHTENVTPDEIITQETATNMLSDDLLHVYGPEVTKLLDGAPTNDNQFGAMLSLAYNVGVGGLGTSTVLRQH